MLRNFFRGGRQNRLTDVLLLAFSTCIVWSSPGLAEPGILHLRCTSVASGASWLLVVDLDHGLVDSRPATISDTWIKWRDAGGGIYELERATGKLQLRAASSTGGFFVHYTCQSE
jgi:hypothetical protein